MPRSAGIRAVRSSGRSSMNAVVSRPGLEVGLLEQRLEERDVGRDAADAELRERAAGRRTAVGKSRPRQVSLTSIESKWAPISAPTKMVPPSRRTPAPPAER